MYGVSVYSSRTGKDRQLQLNCRYYCSATLKSGHSNEQEINVLNVFYLLN